MQWVDGSPPEWKEIYCQFSLPIELKVNTSNIDLGHAVASSGYWAPVGRRKYENSLLNFSMVIGPFTGQSGYRLRNVRATQCFLVLGDEKLKKNQGYDIEINAKNARKQRHRFY